MARFVRIARKQRLDYDGFLYVCQQARRKLGLRKPRQERRLPQLLTESDLKRFFRVIQQCGNVQYEIMLKLLFYTAVRVSELVRIQVHDLDLDGCLIFIDQGKGSKDRYILFPASFRLVLKSHLRASPQNRYLFETRRCGPFTSRRIQQIVQKYRQRADIDQRVHPHLFRHQMLTYLTAQGLSDAQIQLISGHESKRSLEVYQHLSLEQVEQSYRRRSVISTYERKRVLSSAAPVKAPPASRRLSILTQREIDDLYGLPRFSDEDRQLYFDMSATERARAEAIRTVSASPTSSQRSVETGQVL